MPGSYEDRLYRRNTDLAMVNVRWVQSEVAAAVKEWVSDKTDEAKKANLPPFMLQEPLSEGEIIKLVVEKLAHLGGTPAVAALVPPDESDGK